MAVAFNYGQKGDDGNRPTQWVECALFGKRAESLEPYMLKGTQAEFIIDAPHIETYQKNGGGEGVKLTGRVLDIELVGSRQDAGGTQQRQTAPASNKPPAQQQKQQANKPADNFDEFDDSIPF
jgi:single-strand DNA-binding protein